MIIIMAYEKKNYGKWNGSYKKAEKPVYKPKRGPLKPLMTEVTISLVGYRCSTHVVPRVAL